MVDLTFRTDDEGRWGIGKGSNLEPEEVDRNFYAIDQAITDLEAGLTEVNNLESISRSGTNLYFHMHDGTTIGPVPIPVLLFNFRDEWLPDTGYFQLDIVFVTGVGLYAVMEDHTSAATFDEAATGTGPLYRKLFGFSGSSGVNLADLGDVALTSLADGQIIKYDSASGKWINVNADAITSLSSLSDVLITSITDGQVIRWVDDDGKWENVTLGTMADQDASAVDITGGTITGLPAPTSSSDAATKAYVDLVGAAGLPSIGDGELLSRQTGSSGTPSGHSLSSFLDYVLGSTRGAIMVRDNTGWVKLDPGTLGQFLATGGAGADAFWDAPAGSGTVTSVGSGAGLSGGPITASGTLALAAIATDRFLANVSGISGTPVATTLSAFMDSSIGSTRGTIAFRGASGWTFLAPGSAGQFLQSNGAGLDISWGSPAGSGTVTSIATGTGLTGGPITGTGTISFDAIADLRLLANISGGSLAPSANTLTAILDAILGTTRGAIITRQNAAWVKLNPGTAGQVLKSNGAAADLSWANSTSASFAGLGDVDVSVSLANHDLVWYLSSDTKFHNATISAALDAVFGSSRGGTLFRGASGWSFLAAGKSGFFLQTRGTSNDPQWNSIKAGSSTTTATSFWLQAAELATDAPLAANTYSNGTLGVGATLTGNSNGALSIDGTTPSVSDRILVKDEVTASHNGMYAVTTVGSGGAAYVLTRVTDYDQSAEVIAGTAAYVLNGTANGGTMWVMVHSGTITMGSTAIDFEALSVGMPVCTAGQILGNPYSYDAPASPTSLSLIIDRAIASVQGDILYRDGSSWVGLAPGTSGYFLKTQGAGANPIWDAPAGGSTLAGDSDVNISSPANKDVLKYQTSDSKWHNVTMSALLDDVFSSTQGALLKRGSSTWGALAPGTDTYGLIMSGSDPAWGRVGGGGDHPQVSAATTAVLPACTYANGTSGVGATLTGNSNGALTAQDGVTLGAGDRLLVKNQAAALQNGIYVVTTVGSGGAAFVLTRATDCNSALTIFGGDTVAVISGTVNSTTLYMFGTSATPLVLGTTGITLTKIAGSGIITSNSIATDTDVSLSSLAQYDQLIYNGSAWANQRPRYIVAAAALSGVMTTSQKVLYHRFSKAVTFPANFGSYLGHASEAGGSANATASTAFNVDKAPTATPNTFSNVGTITFATGTVTPTFASSGGAAVSFAQGDVLRIVAPSSADATFADFYSTLVGYET